jgi:hypothetical protein
VKVHSFTLSFTPGLPFLAYNLATPCLGCEPKARVVTVHVMNAEIKDVNVCDEQDVETFQMPNSFEKQIPMFGDALFVNSINPRTGAYKLPMCARVT